MRTRLAQLALSAFVLVSCADNRTATSPERPAIAFDHAPNHPSVRISEIHYDNSGTDAGEAIEISGPAGTDLSGWSVVLYNGNGGAAYNTRALSGVLTDQCHGRGVSVLTYPVNGIQNGNPDAIALVNAGGSVVEFLSYGGTQTGVGGPADGLLSTDIGVTEGSATPAGHSLQRKGDGTWNAPAANSFGACNDDAPPPPPAAVASVTVTPNPATITVGGTQAFTAAAFDVNGDPVATTFTWSSSAASVATVDAGGVATAVAAGDAEISAAAPNGVSGSADLHVDPATTPGGSARFSEIHYDNVGVDQGEAIEIEGDAGTDLAGWSIVLYNGSNNAVYNTRVLSGVIGNQCAGRGVVTFTYPTDGLQNGSPDGFALVDASGTLVEFLSYEGTMTGSGGPAGGVTSTDIGVSEGTSAAAGGSLQRNADGSWNAQAPNSFGACNGSVTPPPPTFTFSFSGRDPVGDPALPVGFQDQLFVTVRNSANQVVTTTITWSSDSPAIASVDDDGVVSALAAGTAIIRATSPEGTATFSLPTTVAIASGTAQYGGNAEFGEPADADATDDILVRRAQYTASYNPVRRIPNWVAYNIDATHFGPQDRCDCFTFDPELPAPLTRYTTADYTGAGAIAGYGIDRGHLARSFDRTSGSLDNATTYYFSNIIPQAADNNQGPWAIMENFLGDQARFNNREVYVIAGASGSKGTLKNEGLITIPSQTWKVALILPRDQGLSSVDSWDDVEAIAVIMPNDPGIRNVDWNTYRVTIDQVEALSGYDLFALLPDQVEIAVESGTRPPVAAVNGPFAGAEGSAIAMSAAGSTDADGDALSYSWNFGDGATGSGASVSHTYAQNGSYTVTVVVTDALGLTDDVATTVTVSNVAPVVGAFGGATLLPGETYTASGSFTDPGADSWSAMVDYGDGGGASALPLGGRSFSLSHTYSIAGTFTVTVSVNDGEATGSGTQTVTVLTPAQGVDAALLLVAQLSDAGLLNAGNANALSSKLEAARAALQRGNTNAANGQLGAAINQLDAFIQSGRLTFAQAAPLRAMLNRILAAIG